MSYQNISTSVAAGLTAVKAAIATINSKLPFLVDLSNEEQKNL